ncbi:GNAT family N-acetyltransferase [Erwinia tasmaniensis]|uniref:Probable ribosomal-protein-serine acetyltransferase n=1 Tax=Erwinia tasmaniensis (strain DSM 17950 / CFBP 7177 / CIP 109463 / NCPPB 4357 / Et1/99) TaxID=465817 RepID=B2VHI3_ERWT9|nr:GNAT family N-acetyltransferase [Erwinia tasmaniensis]CAO97696.1 Probable ribosomal-protein-serine acetyltransferase [Erwinia tasmaniensis Et1/99]
MNLVLRPFEDSHADAFAHAVNESLGTLLPWMGWAHENYTPEDALKWFHYTHLQRQREQADESGIFSNDGQLLGGVGIRYADEQGSKPALGYWVRCGEQRKGIASTAVRMLAAKAFMQRKAETIEILIAESNHASRAVATRVGAKLIDVRFGLIVLASGPIDTAIYHLHRPHQVA